MRYAFLFALIVAGCAAEPGDTYENPTTRERIQITRVGECQAIKAAYDAQNELAASAITGEFANEQGLKLSLMTLPIIDDGITGDCFAYEQRKVMTGGPWFIDGRETRTINMNCAYIRPMSYLDEWERVK